MIVLSMNGTFATSLQRRLLTPQPIPRKYNRAFGGSHFVTSRHVLPVGACSYPIPFIVSMRTSVARLSPSGVCLGGQFGSDAILVRLSSIGTDGSNLKEIELPRPYI
jgi:hypothetical protein